MPEGLRMIALALTTCCHLQAGMLVTGVTGDQMRFEGELVAVKDGLVHISRNIAGEPVVRGLPVDSIQRIGPVELPRAADFLKTMEPILPLVHRWDRELIPLSEEALGHLARTEDWSGLHHWTVVFSKHSLPPALREEVLLMQAWALVEMHLVSRARQILDRARPGADPLELPWRHCWVLARIHLEQGQFTEARQWASLPLLRIPSATGPAARELNALLQSLAGMETS